MIDIQKEITNKFPKLANSRMIKKSLFKIARKLIHEDDINKFLNENNHLESFDFIDAVLDYFKFDFTYSSNDIENIPSTGRVVIIANHPLGALDALSLLKLVSKVRKDVKIVANDFLEGFDPLKPLFINIDNFKSKQAKENIQKIYNSLNNDEAIIIFPAGEVSRVSPTGIKDNRWQKGFLKFASKTNSPILPILVDAKNSKTFYTLSILNKTFSTLLLSDEMFKQKDKNITIKIGKIIPNENIAPKALDKDYVVSLYKKHIYALKKGKKQYFQTQNPIARSEDRKTLKKELKESQLLGETNDGKKIYLFQYHKDSAVINEIGRLREVSFRQVNEGVNKKRDIDIYDKYYEHIVLWDEEELEIVGAYRIANGAKVHKEFGVYGFYTNTLFRFKKEFEPYLKDSIELGRSFVQPKYWGSRALDYLWYGIGAYLKNNPQIKYMYGPVSLSPSLPLVAKELIIHFYKNYFGFKELFVNSTNPFNRIKANEEYIDIFTFDDYKKDFKKLKTTLNSLGVAVPTLYKQYSELCEEGGVEFHGFNIDPDFSNCIDGFIFVRVDKVKSSKRQRYIEN